MRTRIRTGGVVLAVATLAVAGGAWYAFRPDTLFLNRVVNEPPIVEEGPGGGRASSLLAVGHFHDVRHAGAGDVTIHRRVDGSRVLRLAGLQVDNGPDLHVWLVAAADAWDDETVKRAEVVPLGRLKGNRGNQNYDLPVTADLARFRAVVIWCERFGVNFATAPLMAP